MMVGGTVFRVQCTFPNMEIFAFLHKKSYKIGKNQKKIGMVVGIVWCCFQGSV